MLAKKEDETLVGEAAEAATKGASRYTRSYPIQRLIPEKWEEMMHVWSHAFYNVARKAPDECVVVITEAPLVPRETREYIGQCMLRSFQVAAVNFIHQETAALFSTGMTTGIVVDSGYSVTRSVAVVEGALLSHTYKFVELGGQDVSAWIHERLPEVDDEVDLVKRTACYIPEDMEQERKDGKGVTMELQRGEVHVPLECRIEAPNILFDPKACENIVCLMEKCEYESIQSMVADTLLKAAPESQKSLAANVVLVGGNSKFHNYGARLNLEVNKELNERHSIVSSVKVKAAAEREYQVWLGANIFSMLDSIKWCTQDLYDEEGGDIFGRIMA